VVEVVEEVEGDEEEVEEVDEVDGLSVSGSMVRGGRESRLLRVRIEELRGDTMGDLLLLVE
jgi:hypothetical protein